MARRRARIAQAARSFSRRSMGWLNPFSAHLRCLRACKAQPSLFLLERHSMYAHLGVAIARASASQEGTPGVMENGHNDAIALPYLTRSLGFLIGGYHEANVLGNSATGVMRRAGVGVSGLQDKGYHLLSANPDLASGLGRPALVSAV